MMHPVVRTATGTKQQRCGSITFVDLAGSERSGDSTYHSKEQIKQTADINTSLSALKVQTRRGLISCSCFGVPGSSTLRVISNQISGSVQLIS